MKGIQTIKNPFRTHIDILCAGMTRQERKEKIRKIIDTLEISISIFNNWYQGRSVPSSLEQSAINSKLQCRIYE
jgi:hypothetical protein